MWWKSVKLLRILFVLPAFLLAMQTSAGTLLLTLSSPDDLSSLTVGQTTHVDVTLSGLLVGEQLVTLTSGVSFDGPLLGTPTAIQAGSIVPNPLASPLDFQTVSAAGAAHASFLTFSNNASEQIVSNGILYGFDFKAIAPGSGTLQFDPLALIGEQFDATNLNLPILRFIDIGPALTFTIKAANGGGGGGGGGGTSVPLPGGLPAMFVWMTGLGAVLIGNRKWFAPAAR